MPTEKQTEKAREPKPYLEAYTALLVDLTTNHPDVARRVADRLERRHTNVALTRSDALVEAYRFSAADIRRELATWEEDR